MDFFQAVRVCFSKYATFQGRAQRSELWWFALFSFAGQVVLSFVDMAAFNGGPEGVGVFSAIFSLALLLPSISVGVRRLHDTDRSGWWVWIALVPLVGWIVLLVFYLLKGTNGANRYGPDPLGGISGDDDGDYASSSVPSVPRR